MRLLTPKIAELLAVEELNRGEGSTKSTWADMLKLLVRGRRLTNSLYFFNSIYILIMFLKEMLIALEDCDQ